MALAENISVLPTPPKGAQRAQSFAPPVPTSRVRRRHVVVFLTFLAFVVAPAALSALYLWTRAADQFASTVAFSVRSEEVNSGLELLGGIAEVSGSGANDSDIVYDYLGSQQLIEQIDTSLGLGTIWSRPADDFVFGFVPTAHIEDLLSYWDRMVDVSHDTSRGIIEVRTKAFDPVSAQAINEEILARSTELVNSINNVANDDAVRYALDDLQRAKVQLANARQNLTEFRIRNEIVDPALDAEIHATLLASLDGQLTETLIEIEILSSNTGRSDTRLSQARIKTDVLQARIEQERRKRAQTRAKAKNAGIAELFSEYERLRVDVEFAEQRYQTSRANFDSALSDARRNTRYLAAHVLPTIAQKSQYPQRELLFAMIVLGGFLIWSLTALIGFSFLDRR